MCESLIKKDFQIPQACYGRLNLRTKFNELLQGPKILNKNYQEVVRICLDNQNLKPPDIRLTKIPHWCPSGQWPRGNKFWLTICCSYLLNMFSILVLGSDWTRNDITYKNYTIIRYLISAQNNGPLKTDRGTWSKRLCLLSIKIHDENNSSNILINQRI